MNIEKKLKTIKGFRWLFTVAILAASIFLLFFNEDSGVKKYWINIKENYLFFSKWELNTYINEFNNEEYKILSNKSEKGQVLVNHESYGYGGNSKINLIHEKHTKNDNIELEFDIFLFEKKVEYRFDNENIVLVSPRAVGKKIVINNVKEFKENLENNKKLIIQISSYEKNSEIYHYVFDIRGFNKEYKKIN